MSLKSKLPERCSLLGIYVDTREIKNPHLLHAVYKRANFIFAGLFYGDSGKNFKTGTGDYNDTYGEHNEYSQAPYDEHTDKTIHTDGMKYEYSERISHTDCTKEESRVKVDHTEHTDEHSEYNETRTHSDS